MKKVIEVFTDIRVNAYEIPPLVENHLNSEHYSDFISKLKSLDLFAGRIEDRLKRGQTIRQRRRGKRVYYKVTVYRDQRLRYVGMKRERQALAEEVHEVEGPLRVLWTGDQVKALTEGFDKYKDSGTRWAHIKNDRDYRDILGNKSNVDLKDKARNLKMGKLSGIVRSQPRRASRRVIDSEDDDDKDGEQDDSVFIKRRRSEEIDEEVQPRLKRIDWTKAEEEALVEGHTEYINKGCKVRWSMILKDDRYHRDA